MGNESSSNKSKSTNCSERHDGICRPQVRCFKCGQVGHKAPECEFVTIPRCFKCDKPGHKSHECDKVVVSKNLEEKVQQLEGQIDKMIKLNEQVTEKKSDEASSSENAKENSEVFNNPFYKTSPTKFDSQNNMNSTDLAGTPLQFNSPPSPPAPAMQQTPMFSQPQNFLPCNQRANEPFPNELPSNPPLMSLYPNIQPLYPQPPPSNVYIQQQHAFPNNQPIRPQFNISNPQSNSNQNAPFSKPLQNQPNEFNQNRNLTDQQQQQPCPSNQNAQHRQFKNSDPQSTSNQNAPFNKPFQNQPNEFNQNRNSTDQQQQPCPSNQNAQHRQFKNSNPPSTFNLNAPFSKPFQNQLNEFNQNRSSTDRQQQQPSPSNQNAQHRQFKNSDPQSTFNQNAPFNKPFQNQLNEFNQNRSSTDRQQQPFSNNQNAQHRQFKNSDPQSTSNQNAPFNKSFQNEPNEFNQNRNSTEFSRNQRRGGHFGGRHGFNRGSGNRGGWKTHSGNKNSKNGHYGNRGRGGFAKGSQNNSEYSLFVGGRSNQTKSNGAETNSSDEKGDFSKTTIVERKEVNEERKNRNHQGVIRGGIHKERVIVKGRDPHKVHGPLPKKNDCSSDSDSASAGYEAASNLPKQKKKKSRSQVEKKKKEVCPDSTENSEDKKSGVVQEKEGNLPLSKKNLGEGGILMKYIGSSIPNIADAINDNVSLYHKVEGVMLMSDPTSDEPIMERAKNLIHIIEFKLQHPKAKSFFC